MKIRVKHKETEIEVDDVTTGKDYGLIYYNQEYILKLLKEMTENIIKIQGGNNE
jgi:hypothetical protein